MENFDKELEHMAALESALVQLGSLKERIEKDGMSKGMAMEAQDLIPDFNNNRPLAYYDNRPSFVAEYKTSLEAIEGRVVVAIAAAMAALAIMVGQFIAYMFGSKKSSNAGGSISSGESKVSWKGPREYNGKTYSNWNAAMGAREKDLNDYLRKATDDIFKNLDEAQKEFQKADANRAKANANHSQKSAEPPPPPPPKTALQNLDALIDEEIKRQGEDSPIGRILHAENFFMHDFIHSGEYTTTMLHMLDVAPKMRKSLTALQGEIATVTRDYAFVMENPDLPKERRQEVMERLPMAFNTKGRFRDTDWHIRGSVDRIETAKTNAQSKAVKENFKYSQLVNKVQAATAKLPVNEVIKIFKECEDDLGDLHVKLEKLSEGMDKYKGRKDLSDFQEEYQGEAGQALNNLRGDVVNTIKFMNELDRFGRFVRQLENRVQRMQVEAVRLIGEFAKASNVKLSPDIKKLEKEMLEALTVDM